MLWLRRLLILSVLLMVVIIVGGLALWVRSLTPQSHRFILSNGSVVTFTQATFGTNHVVAVGSKWIRLLPKFLAQRFRPPFYGSSFTTASPEMMLWFEHRRIPNATGYDYTCSLVHPDGTETSFGNTRSYANWTPTNTLEGRSFPYPQRDKFLRVRFYEQKNYDTVELLGEFMVRNPQVSRAPLMTAPPLPQRTNDGDLEITLASLESPVRRGRWDKTNFLSQWTRARFSVAENGMPSDQWGVAGMEAIDSTGTRLLSQSWSESSEKDLEKFECQPVLWPSETYRLRFEFSRKAEAPFSTNELWTIRGVPVPTNGGFTLVNTQWNTGPFTVRFHGLNSKDGQPPWEKHYSGEPSLGFSIQPPPKGYRFNLIGITDETGKKVEVTGSGYSDTNWGFGIRLKPGMQKVDVAMALHRSRFADFTAQPSSETNQVR